MFDLKVDDEIILRTVEEGEAYQLFSLVDHNREYLGAYLPWVDHTHNIADSKAFISQMIAETMDGTSLGVGIWVKGELAGHAGIMDIVPGHKATLGYWVAENFSGAGIMTRAISALVEQAFTKYSLRRLLIEARSTNEKSISLALRLGFQHEGAEVAGEFFRGEFYNLERFGLVRKPKAVS